MGARIWVARNNSGISCLRFAILEAAAATREKGLPVRLLSAGDSAACAPYPWPTSLLPRPVIRSTVVAASVSIDNLVELNDEIAGLVRAGIPLDLGLASMRNDLAGPLRKTIASLESAIARGQTLDEALADPAVRVPAVYSAVVRAGLRSGRLPAALEALAESSRSVRALQRSVGLALIYPLILLTLAYALIVLFLMLVVPSIALMYEAHPPGYLVTFSSIAKFFSMGISIPSTNLQFPLAVLPPVLLWVTAIALWFRNRSSMSIGAPGAWRWLPLGSTALAAQNAWVAEVFALLIEHHVPLPEAVRLALACTNDPRRVAAAEVVALRLEAGQTPTAEQRAGLALPTSLAMLISSGMSQSSIVGMARNVAASQRRQVERRSAWMTVWLPVILVLTIGVAIGLVYGLTFFIPFTQMLDALSQPMPNSMRVQP
jgi:general secretion pathway protein F